MVKVSAAFEVLELTGKEKFELRRARTMSQGEKVVLVLPENISPLDNSSRGRHLDVLIPTNQEVIATSDNNVHSRI